MADKLPSEMKEQILIPPLITTESLSGTTSIQTPFRKPAQVDLHVNVKDIHQQVDPYHTGAKSTLSKKFGI